MARFFTTEQRALLRSADLNVNVLATFYLDEGTYRFCDENSGYDLSDGTNTYIGANALLGTAEIRASKDLTAEGVTLICDGNRMAQAGVEDPARVLREMLDYLYQQRRVDYAFGLRPVTSQQILMTVPAFAGKINSARLVDRQMDFTPGSTTTTQLEIVLDALAARYSRAGNRLRSHEDQQEIDPTDMFYSYTQDVVANERTVYWGKAAPFNTGTGMSVYDQGSAFGKVRRYL